MFNQNTLYRVWALHAFGVASHTLHEVTNHYDSSEQMYFDTTRNPSNNVPEQVLKKARSVDISAAEETLNYCDKHGIKIVTIDDDEYPNKLASIYNAPTVLFYKGDLTMLDKDVTLAMCGTRDPSVYSAKICAALTSTLAVHNISIIGGFSIGIEDIAQTMALEKNGRVFAFLPCGFDAFTSRVYDRQKDVIVKKGAIISEYLPKTRIAKFTYASRNRLISAASSGVCLIEAGEKSGSLSIISSALSQGRDIFAVSPHDLFDPRYRGNVNVIRDGAISLMGAYDIYREYYEHIQFNKVAVTGEKPTIDRIVQNVNRVMPSSENDDAIQSQARKSIKQNKRVEKEQAEKKELDFSKLTEEQKKIAVILNSAKTPLRPDEIVEGMEIEIDELLVLITEMEIEGYIKNINGAIEIDPNGF